MNMPNLKQKQNQRLRRKRRGRARVFGIALRPRLSVFRSHCHIYGQLINDERGETLAFASDAVVAKEKSASPGRRHTAERVGTALAEKAGALGIKKAAFDRGAYRYTGIIRALADGARKGGLEF